MQETDTLAEELAQSRSELLELSERVQRLIGKRTQRHVLLERLHRTATMPTTLQINNDSHYLCSLCANDYAKRAIQHVRAVTPGVKCDHCGQPAIVWLELKTEEDHESEPG